MSEDRIVMHIDVNSAYLSWEAIHRLENGSTIDLREIPSVVGGDPKTRRGIVLAKSIPAKRYKIQTGETIHVAFQKCPILTIVKPSYGLYMKCSNAMKSVLEEYVPTLQRFSIDEFFIELTDCKKLYGDPVEFAHTLKDAIKTRLGFTVNVGVSTNKLLAKVASDFEKPDNVHTLYPHEIEKKMWPLPVGDLYMVGRSTVPKLHEIGIYTIGDLASIDRDFIRFKLKKHGLMIYDFAHGIEDSALRGAQNESIKGLGNSTTIRYDVTQKEDAYMVLLSLTEMVCMRLREENLLAGLVSVSIRSHDLSRYSHQHKLSFQTDVTSVVFEEVKRLFDASWQGEAIRHLGVRLSNFKPKDFYQYSLLDPVNIEMRRALDQTIDDIRLKYGNKSLIRACFVQSGFAPVQGGTVNDEDYPMMSSVL
ncbi:MULTISPECIES: DNA polymerase IV [unclassified Fusibacter]|uniref:DNA polymerase Y family protein n=1 Tax=unclassified Fusibacter TaxID=2624464 RepID=UPI001010F49D|nr:MULTISPECIES: DNA polymerase IV [unclassified Fusibacter]MCK8061178.1 DNA polymerase IV [Fusibacter sp. A2]NPE23285.1 DNA polymerase IV [Fusibacter sp. A1]RXV59327.1 DNA polymerase IV [Fusibacter sp. A1]